MACTSVNAADILVTSNLDDSGAGCTLREAVASANTSVDLLNGCATGSDNDIDSILFDQSTFAASNTIALAVGELSIADKNIVISGDSVARGIVLVASDEARVMRVRGGQVTLNSLTLTGGNPTFDANIDAETNRFNRGGGLLIEDNSDVTITDSQIVNNSVTSVRDGTSAGGGIRIDNNARLTIENSTISRNRVDNSQRVEGGGISVGDGNTIEISNSKVEENTLRSRRGSGSFAGGMIADKNNDIVITNSSISHNQGGALEVRNDSIRDANGQLTRRDSTVSIIDTRIENNTMGRNEDGFGARDGSAGIRIIGGTDVRLSRTSISNNTSIFQSPIFLRQSTVFIEDSLISENRSQAVFGGGLYSEYSTLHLKNSTISGNQQIGSRGFGSAAFLILSNVYFENVTVSDNALNPAESGAAGGALALALSSVGFSNSIIANSQSLNPNIPTVLECFDLQQSNGAGSTITMDSATIIEGGGCGAERTEDPALLPLADNGGPTLTHALADTSIAINSGLNATCLATDQRGLGRDSNCDVGAFEFGLVVPTLSLTTSPDSIAENNGVSTGTITRNTPFDTPLIVQLSSSDVTSVTVPSQVQIPAGASSATFAITAVDDLLADGDSNSLISANADGFDAVSAQLTVVDDEVPQLTVELSADEVDENIGQAAATLSRNTPLDTALPVSLASNSGGRLGLPVTTFEFPAGEESIEIEFDVIDNAIADGDADLEIIATSDGFQAGIAPITVVDDETPALTLTLDQDSIIENEVLTATVSRNTPTSSALIVSLSSNNTNRATVNSTVEIPAGATSANFTVTGVDNLLADGTQTVNIFASVADNLLNAANANVTVVDNDDADNDTIADTVDNCPSIANTNQANLDGDQFGDVCDSDIDGDGMPNTFEQANGLDPRNAADANADNDGDGFTNLDEFQFGSDPNNADVDENGNGIPDAAERPEFNPATILLLLLDDD